MNVGLGGLLSGPSPEVVAVLGALSVLLFFVGLNMLLASRVMGHRLKQFVGEYQPDAAPMGDYKITDRRRAMGRLERRVMRRRGSAAVRLSLLRAGIGWTVGEYTLIRVAIGVVFGVAGFLTTRDLGILALLPGALAGFLGSLFPVMYVSMKAGRRVAAFEGQLPEALDMMGASLQAGSGLGQAVEMISREMAPPVSDEFRRVVQETTLGLSLYEALVNLSERIGSEDLDLAVTTIGVQFRVGGNLVQILQVITNTIRERVKIKGEIRVLTASQRLSAWVISGVPVALAIGLYIMNPQYMGISSTPGITRCLAGAAVVMIVAGIYSLQKITQVEV